MEWIIIRLAQPSTWRGIIYLATGFGIKVSPDMAESIIAVGLAAVGLINVLRNEKKATQKAVDQALEMRPAIIPQDGPLPWLKDNNQPKGQ